jgi:YD repeat-containing protein
VWGRTVGTKRTGDAEWTCTSRDARGRTIAVEYPDRTAEFTYTGDGTPTGDPLVSAARDGVGTVATVTDLLGRVVSTTDVWGVVTTTGYNPFGQVEQVTVDPPQNDPSTSTFTYDLDGTVETVTVDGVLLADPSYAGGGALWRLLRHRVRSRSGPGYSFAVPFRTEQDQGLLE